MNLLANLLGWLVSVYETPPMANAENAVGIAEGLLALVLLPAIGVSYFGLFTCKPWSRPFTLWLTVVALLAHFLPGYVTNGGWSGFLENLGWMTWGCVLALIYFGDVRHRFARRAKAPERS